MGPVHLEPSKRVIFLPAVIANGQTITPELDLRHYALRGLIIPAGFTGTMISFQAGQDIISGGPGNPAAPTFVEVNDDSGSAVTITVAANTYVVFGQVVAEKLNAVLYTKIRSGTVSAPSTQTQAVTMQMVLVASAK